MSSDENRWFGLVFLVVHAKNLQRAQNNYTRENSWDLVGMMMTRQDWGLGAPVARCQSKKAI